MFRNVHGLTLNSNYIAGATRPFTVKTKQEYNCNVGKVALTRIRHANRSGFAHNVACFAKCGTC